VGKLVGIDDGADGLDPAVGDVEGEDAQEAAAYPSWRQGFRTGLGLPSQDYALAP
jgi:hypothetical protein